MAQGVTINSHMSHVTCRANPQAVSIIDCFTFSLMVHCFNVVLQFEIYNAERCQLEIKQSGYCSLVKWCTGLGKKRFDVRCIMFGVKLSY